MIKCSQCQTKKDYDDFPNDRRYKNRKYRSYVCKECDKVNGKKRLVKKTFLTCEWCCENFEGYSKKDKYCSKGCRLKVQAKRNYDRYKNADCTIRKKGKFKATERVLKRKSKNQWDRYTDEQIKRIMHKTDGRYTESAKMLAFELGRTQWAIALFRSRYKKS
jgi:hypothetical protein